MSKKKFKLSAKQKQNRLNRFISKYGYDPRTAYRPYRQTGTRGRPVKQYAYPKADVKVVNERFRKIEKVWNLTEDSNEYKLARKYATEYSKTKGKIYDQDKLKSSNSVRLLSEAEYNKLSPLEKKYFNEVLQNILNASTTTKKGIEDKYTKSYNTFMETYGSNYKGLKKEEYIEFFRTYRAMVNADKKNQFDYNTLVRTLEYVDIGEALRDDQLKQAMRYISTDRIHKIPKRYRTRN